MSPPVEHVSRRLSGGGNTTNNNKDQEPTALTQHTNISEDNQQRYSLLDSIRNSLDAQARRIPMHRIIVCAEFQQDKLPNGNRQEIGTYYQKFFKQFQDETDVVTGMLFIFSSSLVHVVEGSDKVINSFVRDLVGHSQHQFQSVKVLCTNDDIPQRSFPFWFSRVVELRSVDSAVDLESKQIVVQSTTEACTNLLKLGEYVGGLQKADLKQALDDLYQNNKHLIPRQDLLQSFARCDGIMSIQEWSRLYDQHNIYVSENELIWPIIASTVQVE